MDSRKFFLSLVFVFVLTLFFGCQNPELLGPQNLVNEPVTYTGYIVPDKSIVYTESGTTALGNINIISSVIDIQLYIKLDLDNKKLDYFNAKNLDLTLEVVFQTNPHVVIQATETDFINYSLIKKEFSPNEFVYSFNFNRQKLQVVARSWSDLKINPQNNCNNKITVDGFWNSK